MLYTKQGPTSALLAEGDSQWRRESSTNEAVFHDGKEENENDGEPQVESEGLQYIALVPKHAWIVCTQLAVFFNPQQD